jgi:hypothetical protein
MNRILAICRRPAALWVIALLTLVAGFAGPAAAQEAEGDAPGRVARVADLNGQVWIYTPDSGEWIAAAVNQVLTSNDRIATDNGARAEVRIGSTALRLDGDTELEVVQLDDTQMALQLYSGSVSARVSDPDAVRELTIATDVGRFRFDQPGRYRIDHADNRSAVTVYAGQSTYEHDRVALPVTAGQRSEFWIDEQQVAQYALSAPVQDDFASWANQQDAAAQRYAAPQYVSPEMTGAEDLGQYGSWEQTADDGPVWIPTAVPVGWAPYTTGHWAFVRPWGWTWVDDARWGFAPFHYGRWLWARNRWCWAPGRYERRPIYAPALVAWVGGGRVVAGGGPAVGWFPLGPRDVFVPGYRYSQRYVRDINITHVTNVTVINRFVTLAPERREFVNRRYANAVTVVPANVLTERRPVAAAAAQARATPWAREMATQPTRVAALSAPPVAAPALPARRADPRDIRPPFQRGNDTPGAVRPGQRDMRTPLPPGGARPGIATPNAQSQGVPERPGARPAPAAPGGVTPPLPRANPQAVTPPAQPEVRRPLPGTTNDPRMPAARPDDADRDATPRAPRRTLPGAVEERQPLPGTTNNPRVPPPRSDEGVRTLPAPALQRPPQREAPPPRTEAPQPRAQAPQRGEAPPQRVEAAPRRAEPAPAPQPRPQVERPQPAERPQQVERPQPPQRQAPEQPRGGNPRGAQQDR